MKTKVLIIFFHLFSVLIFCQEKSVNDFKKDFVKVLNSELNETELDKMFQEYPLILTPHIDTTQLFESLKGTNKKEYSMLDFKNENLYKDNIGNLLNSTNHYKRILAYLLIASTNDISKENILLNKIKTETDKGNLIWSGMALLSTKSSHTDELFDFLIDNEDFGDAHMLPLFIKLDKDSLRETAYKRINSEELKSKILAIQILSVTNDNPKTESIVKSAVKDWDMDVKGYAIYTLKELKIGNISEILKPLLNDKRTRAISLQALANSPTKADHEVLISEIDKNKIVDEDVLNALYKSQNIENLKLWLNLIQTKDLPKEYFFTVFDQPLISSDEILDKLHFALKVIKNKDMLGELVRALQNRTDEKSIDLMIELLKNKSSTVRYWTAKTLKNNKSELLNTKENRHLIEEGLNDGNSTD